MKPYKPDFDEPAPVNTNPSRHHHYHSSCDDKDESPPARKPQRNAASHTGTNSYYHPYSDRSYSSGQYYSRWYQHCPRQTFYPFPCGYAPRGPETPQHQQEPFYSEEPRSPQPPRGAYGYRPKAWAGSETPTRSNCQRHYEYNGSSHRFEDWDYPIESSEVGETFLRTDAPNRHSEYDSEHGTIENQFFKNAEENHPEAYEPITVHHPILKSARDNHPEAYASGTVKHSFLKSTQTNHPEAYAPETVQRSSLKSTQAISGNPSDTSYIWDVQPNDILCGRGVKTDTIPGNQAFRDLISRKQVEYLACARNQKPVIATDIMETIRSREGRFLQRVKVPSYNGSRERLAWKEIGEKRVYEKVCQALRDGGPRIRRHMLSMSKQNKDHDKENSENMVSSFMAEPGDHQSLRRTFSATAFPYDFMER